MPVITNTWVEKQRKKKKPETAPSYASDPDAEYIHLNYKKPAKRSTMPSCAILVKTLRGVRK